MTAFEALGNLLRPAVALAAGGTIGLAFGTLQNRARLRHEQLQLQGKSPTRLTAAPGSFLRVGYLLVALVVVQLLCPILFDPQTVSPWCVSAGIAAGYGWVLFSRLRYQRT